MIPARISCPAGWTHDYTGYLMSQHSFLVSDGPIRHSTEYICVDDAPEATEGTILMDQAGLVFVKVGCGTLPCSKFHDGWEVSCVVCSK